jgi:hypothetical protein
MFKGVFGSKASTARFQPREWASNIKNSRVTRALGRGLSAGKQAVGRTYDAGVDSFCRMNGYKYDPEQAAQKHYEQERTTDREEIQNAMGMLAEKEPEPASFLSRMKPTRKVPQAPPDRMIEPSVAKAIQEARSLQEAADAENIARNGSRPSWVDSSGGRRKRRKTKRRRRRR